VQPRLRVSGLPIATETLTVLAAPNVFRAASAQATAPLVVDAGASPDTSTRWSSGDRRIAVVNQVGMVVGRTRGSTIVGATRDGQWSFTNVQVVPPADAPIHIIAHRGFMRRFPENTLVAVRGSFDQGADAVEVDIRLSADGVPVVMHDATVDRTTDGHGAVNTLTAAQLAALNACAHATGFAPCAVPLMSDVLREAYGRGGLLLHLYGSYTISDLEKLLSAVRDAGMDRDVIFICFDYPVLAALRQLDQVAGLGYLTDRPPPPKVIDQLGRAAAIVELQTARADSTATRAYLADVSRQQQDIGVWVAFSQAQTEQAVALGFRTILADVPIDRSRLQP
jgi:glycerophosphoryl diester phosphodiesterase